ncbi:glycosyltransferase involved in cell wall biosynthesis [Silvibacterium bohemicum]|uniref:Glycosyltransferase involved in cell wall biosynthesis n=1 Tax=Silvibacterium bohemicum TaxID=1577686 RepID=A0A841K0A8_9BACT|nr:glycosyltransferase [Silvibacterium bohemicum]MBB6143674.1 glycosyltransferase involved in cell wall biosynthesis [Silvibacterium bohemicum]
MVLWIDWYPYHVARFKGLQAAFGVNGKVRGIELVGGIGVHAGLKFREELPPGLPVDTLLPERSWQEASKLALAFAVWRKLQELGPEMVLVPGYYTLPAIAAAVWAKAHRRTSVLMTESGAADHVRTAWKEKAKSILIRTLFDWMVAGGAAHVRYLRELGIQANRILNFYDVVDNDELRNRSMGLRRSSSGAGHNLPKKYFLYVGRLAPEKNVTGLLNAWLNYRASGGQWSLVLAGDGPEASSLKSLASQSCFAADVIFAGHRNQSALSPFFSFAKCFVLPSVREPWGLVVNEAMAVGLPLIVSNRCGCAEDLVEKGRNGLLFDPEDNEQLAACLHEIEETSPPELTRMGERSLEIIARFSPENFGNEIVNIANRLEHRDVRPVRKTASPERVA